MQEARGNQKKKEQQKEQQEQEQERREKNEKKNNKNNEINNDDDTDDDDKNAHRKMKNTKSSLSVIHRCLAGMGKIPVKAITSSMNVLKAFSLIGRESDRERRGRGVAAQITKSNDKGAQSQDS